MINLESPQSFRQEKELPKYEENFGHIAELIIRSAIEKKAVLFVEKVETGTKPEDYREKVDFWIKFVDVDKPLGIQYTVSDNEEKIRQKIEFLRSRNFLCKKERRHNSEIKWSGITNVVLIRGNKLKMTKIYKESKEKNIPVGELVDNKYIRDFFNQIRIGLEEVDPFAMKTIFSAIRQRYLKK